LRTNVREYSFAKKVRELQNIIGRPSTQDLINYVDKNLIPNCPVTRQDILRAEDILGPNIGSMKGKNNIYYSETCRSQCTRHTTRNNGEAQ